MGRPMTRQHRVTSDRVVRIPVSALLLTQVTATECSRQVISHHRLEGGHRVTVRLSLDPARC